MHQNSKPALLICFVLLFCATCASANNRFVIISDTQNQDGTDKMADEIISLKPAFAIAVGDVPDAFYGFQCFRRLREAGIPIHIAMGNHDGDPKRLVCSSIPPYPLNDEVDPILRFVVENKYYYSFNRGGIHFVITDTSTDDPEAEIHWLEDDLIHHVNNPDRLPTIVFMHYPDWLARIPPREGGPIYQVLAKHPSNKHTVKAAFAGHTHIGFNFPLDYTLGIPTYTLFPSAPFGSSQHTEYVLATVHSDRIVFERKPILDKGEGKDFFIQPIEGNFSSLGN